MAKKKSKSKKKHAIKKPSVSIEKSGHKKKITKKSLKSKQPLTKGSTSVPKTKQEPKKKVGLTLNWNRAIHIHRIIDDSLLKELTPIVLKMKQESSEPITVGIDSPGGNLSAVDSLLGLLKSPDQDGRCTQIYTASTNRAYSAAASLLAFGDYSVAFPHSRILYHDVRYSGIEDVTPSKALETARELERGNIAFSLRLSHHIRSRLIWVYLDLMPLFKEVRNRWAIFAKKYDKAFKDFLPQENVNTIDVVGFSLALFLNLSSPANKEIAINALELLNYWMEIDRIERMPSKKKNKSKKPPDLIEGIDELVREIRSMSEVSEISSTTPETKSDKGLHENARKDIKLLIEVLARRFATDKDLSMSSNVLDMIIDDFMFIKDINENKHVHATTKMLLDYEYIFFGRSIKEEMKKAKDNKERRKIIAPVYPQARILWYYIVLICRCLCRGDHFLSPSDAQLLGLVDEILGGGPVKSAREWRKSSPEYE
jgi:ATP-dependent protease ClpP protease subunit